MKSILEFPIVRDLHARGLLFPAVVLLAVAGVLVHGALSPQASAEGPDETSPLPSTPTLPTVRPDLEKTPLAYFSDYWYQLAKQSRNKMLLIGRDEVPAIVVAPGIALSPIRAADDIQAQQLEQKMLAERRAALKRASSEETEEATEKSSAGKPVAAGQKGPELAAPAEAAPLPEPKSDPYTLLGTDVERELALFDLQIPYGARPFSRSDPTALNPGAYIAAVGLSPEGQLRVTPGVLSSVRPGSAEHREVFEVSIPFPDDTQAAAIVDLDGALLGVAIESRQGIRVLSSEAIQQIIDRTREKTPCRSIQVSDLPDAVREVLRLGSEGVLVEQVKRHAFLPEPSVLAGDILLEWGGAVLKDAQQFNQLYESAEPGSLMRYSALRGQRRVRGATVMPAPDCRPPAESMIPFARMGVVLKWEKQRFDGGEGELDGWKVMGVLDDSPAAAGGLMRNDWIISVQGRPLTREDAERTFEAFESRPRPMVLTVRRGDRVRLAAILPEEETPGGG